MPVLNFETISGDDVTTTTTLLHEVLPLTGTIVSGTYGEFHSERNVKDYVHGQFQSVYDYPYLSSSANHIFDLTVGYDESSVLSGSASVQNSKKINMYNQMAQVLLGYTASTSAGIRKFENDLQLDGTGSMRSGFFMSFSRLLTKDQIKKGSFSITLGTGSWDSPFAGAGAPGSTQITLADVSASATQGGTSTADGGTYGVLYDNTGSLSSDKIGLGVIFYQAGIVFLTSSIFLNATKDFNKPQPGSTGQTPTVALTASTISSSCDALRHRIRNVSFNNTTEINSKIYFCRVPHNKFNYSSNPTYTSGSKIVVKNNSTDNPVAYVTTVGLYNSSGELLAVAKLSEPLRKDPTNDITIRVRLDY